MAAVTEATVRRASILASPHDVVGAVLLEVRRVPDKAVTAATIAGAHLATLVEHFAGEPATGEGEAPLPDRDRLEAQLAAWGIGADTPVIVYAADNAEVSIAARAWLVLRWTGIKRTRLLDGGLAAWRGAEGGPSPGQQPGTGTFVEVPITTISADEAERIAARGVLLDARNREAYLGDGTPRSGHIPGAVSAPASDLFKDGRLVSELEIRSWADEHGYSPDRPTGAYCGRGVAASVVVLALATIGIDTPIYIGSWTAWSTETWRPVETGESTSHG